MVRVADCNANKDPFGEAEQALEAALDTVGDAAFAPVEVNRAYADASIAVCRLDPAQEQADRGYGAFS